MIKILKKIFRWILIPTGIFFVLFNLVTYLVLNIPDIQRSIVSYLNDTYLKPAGYAASIDSLSVNLVPTQLNLNGLQVRKLVEENQIEKVFDPKINDQSIEVDTLAVGIHVVQSYVLRRPILSSVVVEGANIQIVTSDEQSTLTMEDVEGVIFSNGRNAYANAARLLPGVVHIEKSILDIRNPQGQVIHSLNVNQLEVSKQRKNRQGVISISGDVASYFFFIDRGIPPLQLSDTSLKLGLQENDEIVVESLRLGGKTLQGETKGTFKLARKILNSNYELETDTTVFAQPALALVELAGDGQVHVNGNLRVQKLTEVPTFQGKANWKKVKIEGFDVYSGESNVEFKNMIIHGRELNIRTPRGAILHGFAEFEMFDAFVFRGELAFKELWFLELMRGLTADTNAFDFLINAQRAEIEGQIVGNKENDFFIKAKLQPQFSSLQVPGEQFGKNGFQLPACRGDVNVHATEFKLDLTGTTVSCNDGKDLIEVKSGTVVFETSKANFDIEGSQVPLSPLSYFLGTHTEGTVSKLNGNLSSSSSQPLIFSGNLESSQVSLFGFQFTTLSGNLAITEEMVFGNGLEGVSERTQIFLDRFSVRFDDLFSEFKGSASGDLFLSTFVEAGYVPTDFAESGEAKIKAFDVDLSGPLFKPWQWNLNSTVALEKLKLGPARSENVRVSASCEVGVCRNSRVQFVGLSSVAPFARVAEGTSVATFEISELSFETVNMRAAFSRLPMSLFGGEDFPLNGTFNGRLEMNGPWKQWQGGVNAAVEDFQAGSIEFGTVSVRGISNTRSGLTLNLSGKSDQFQVRISTPSDLKGNAKLNARINGFDVSSFVDGETRARLNLLSRVSADFELSGKAPLTRDLNEVWYKTWTGDGRISRIDMQSQQFTFELREPANVRFDGDFIRLSELQLLSQRQEFLVRGNYNVNDDAANLTMRGNLALGAVQLLTPRISAAEGTISAKLNLTGPLAAMRLSGEATVKGQSLTLRDLAPPLSDIEAELIFENDRMEIRSLTAQKGSGTVDVAGSVSWGKLYGNKNAVPDLAIRITATNTQFRLPARVFGFVDSAVSGNVQIAGGTLPYSISGNVVIQRLIASRDINCQDVIEDLTRRQSLEQLALSQPTFVFNLSIVADRSIYVQSECMRARLSADLKLTGPTEAFSLSGTARAENGYITYQKRRFTIQKWDMYFENPVKVDPRVDVQVMNEISNYKVYINATGTLGGLKTDIWSDPSNYPTGEAFTRQDILRMLSSGQVPQKTTGAQSSGYVIATSAADLIITPFDDPLSQTIAVLTGGIIDNVQIRPLIEEGGQNKLKARVTKSIGERLNLSVDVDLGPASVSNTQTLRSTFLLNDTVNLLSELDRETSETTSRLELLGGVRFQFGSE